MRIALFLTLILAWIALGLPMAGMLGSSMALRAGVSLVLCLAVMLAALDVTTAGLRQLLDFSIGVEALAFLASLLSCVDAALVLLGYSSVMPFCAVGAAAMTAALWGERLYCLGLIRSFRTASATRDPGCITAEAASGSTPGRLFRAEYESTRGFVRRSEGSDLCSRVYRIAAPIILLAAFVLSIAASLNGNSGYFLHTFSALVSVGTSFAAFFGFSLPYSITAQRLRSSGAALAGFAGCEDIVKAKQLVLVDSDLFPPGNMKFSAINILDGVPQQRVISAACSLLYASGSGLKPLFSELAERRGVRVPDPREYTLHESGGISGIVNGEPVDVGPARFMNLRGIRLPKNLAPQNAVCVAIGGELVGVFTIEYNPTTSVQEALVTILRSRTSPVFAVMDFNITPKMIHELFKLPTESFNFPPYRERVRFHPDDIRPIAAVVSRKGLMPMVEAIEAGRKLYSSVRLITVLSLLGTVIGMAILFPLCLTEAFSTASVGNVLSFMVLWALAAVILSNRQRK